ncbi:MAG TPA: hypothetical protein VM639_14450 [Dongiaceae bacterium]|nr:hypothetical protein [Dongiaceae bacterium]
MDGLAAQLERQWAKISYQMPVADQKAAFRQLLQQAAAVRAQFPDQALPIAWQGIILCSYAEATGGLQALDDVKQARDLLLQAKAIDPDVLAGTIDGYLGTLYYKVPPWPVGFGDRHRSLLYFQQALAVNPAGIDANLLYGLYLIDAGSFAEARAHLTTALQAPVRAGHSEYDTGRRQDIEAALARLR